VKILAGPDGRVSYSHSTILESCGSPYLQSIISGDWKEADERVITWPKVDHETVQRFICFIYTDDYAVTEPSLDGRVLVAASGGNSKALQLANRGAYQAIVPWDSQNVAESQKRPLLSLGDDFSVSAPATSISTQAGTVSSRYANDTSLDPTEGLLDHAKLYTFAGYLGLESLERLSLQRLFQLLSLIQGGRPWNRLSVTDTIRYVYENTTTRLTMEEPARKLLANFAALNFTSLLDNDFQNLIRECSDFSIDLSTALSRTYPFGQPTSNELQRLETWKTAQEKRLRKTGEK
jgi:hypothetical protein